MTKHYDNVHSFYSSAKDRLGEFVFAPSAYACIRVGNATDDSGAGLFFGLVAAFIASPLNILTFCLALLVALPLALVAPFAFLGAIIVDKIEEGSNLIEAKIR